MRDCMNNTYVGDGRDEKNYNVGYDYKSESIYGGNANDKEQGDEDKRADLWNNQAGYQSRRSQYQ